VLRGSDTGACRMIRLRAGGRYWLGTDVAGLLLSARTRRSECNQPTCDDRSRLLLSEEMLRRGTGTVMEASNACQAHIFPTPRSRSARSPPALSPSRSGADVQRARTVLMYVYAACMLVITRRVQATGIHRLLKRAIESTALHGVVGRGGTPILALWRPLLQFTWRSHLTYSTLDSTPFVSDKQVLRRCWIHAWCWSRVGLSSTLPHTHTTLNVSPGSAAARDAAAFAAIVPPKSHDFEHP